MTPPIMLTNALRSESGHNRVNTRSWGEGLGEVGARGVQRGRSGWNGPVAPPESLENSPKRKSRPDILAGVLPDVWLRHSWNHLEK